MANRTLRAADRTVAATVRFLSHIRLRIRAIELARDPETRRWIDETRARQARGELEALIRAQPEDPRTLLVQQRPGPA